MSAKRRKIQQPAEDLKAGFLLMNSDCILKVFEWLELDDLCSVSESCKQLQALSSDYFLRKHNDKLSRGMRIVLINGKIELQPKERYVKSFSHCFDTLIVHADSRWPLNFDVSKLVLPSFIRENCNENLSTIQFHLMVLHQSFGDNIVNILENVETVVFWSCDLEGTYHHMLKHCKNLKYLTIGGDYGNKIDELLLETYPKLEHFQCRYYGRVLMTNNLRIFLRQHPNLKRLAWCFHARIREQTFSDKTLECIETIVENGKKLEELFVSFDGTYNLENISERLEELCNRDHFQRLELDFRFTTLGYKVSQMIIEQGHHLAKLKSLRGLHLCHFTDYANNVLPTLTSFKDLRILQLDCVATIKGMANIPLGGMDSLEELHITTLANIQFIQQFICQLGKLKLISILNCKFNISRLDLPMLNVERRKISFGVCELIIYVDIETKKAKTDDYVNGELVKIEYVDFQMDPCNLSNPFIQRTIVK